MSLFRKESVDYKRQKLHGEVILVQPVRFFVITAVFFVLTLTLLAFLSRGEFHRKENVFGYINPSKGMSVIRAEQGGRLTQMYVNEGDIVEVGQILFESQIDISTENGFIAERRLENTDVRLLELKDQKSAIKQRYSLDRDRLSTQISILERELQTLRKGQNINEELGLEAIKQQIIGIERNLSELNFSLRGLDGSKERESSQLRLQIAQLEENRTSLEASSRYVVKSPINGTITALEGKVGQALIPSTPLITIVPENSDLIATLLAPTQAAAFLEPGQDVNLLIDAFPYQKFGVKKGVISEISATPFRPGELEAPIHFEQPVYRINVKLDKETVLAYGNEVSLKPGMTLQGDLITDRRTLIEWILDPLFTLKRS